MTRHHCGVLLKRARQKASLTLRRLAELSGVPHPNIALIESGKKTCGPTVATRLANALKIQGRERVDFLAAAIRTTRRSYAGAREGLTGDELQALASVLTARLKAQGVDPERIARISAAESGSHLVIELGNGQCYRATLNLEPQLLMNFGGKQQS